MSPSVFWTGLFSTERSSSASHNFRRLRATILCTSYSLTCAVLASSCWLESVKASGTRRSCSILSGVCTRQSVYRRAFVPPCLLVVLLVLIAGCTRLSSFPCVYALSSSLSLDRGAPSDVSDPRPGKYVISSSAVAPSTEVKQSLPGEPAGASARLMEHTGEDSEILGLDTPASSSRTSRNPDGATATDADPGNSSSYGYGTSGVGEHGLSGFLRWVGGDEDGWIWASGEENVSSSYSDEGVTPEEATRLKLLRERKALDAEKAHNGSSFFGVRTQLLSLLDVQSGRFTADELLDMAEQESKQSGPDVRTPEERQQPLFGQPLDSRKLYYRDADTDTKATPSLFSVPSTQSGRGPEAREHEVSGPASYPQHPRRQELPHVAPMSFINWQLLGATMSNPALQVTGSPLAAPPIVFRQPDPGLALSHHGKLVAVMAAVMVIGLVVLLLCCFMVQRKRAHEAYMRRPLTVPTGARRS
ncbi:transmembrane protein [Cystoisospora suis]|uniref:Transmembrane protein n=1 Tax=Cystoisospora suis TaxID=483139 RepID=A0A2C6KMN9_9APIC|nr:transmembrane protein [Cystoisospora suis]